MYGGASYQAEEPRTRVSQRSTESPEEFITSSGQNTSKLRQTHPSVMKMEVRGKERVGSPDYNTFPEGLMVSNTSS